MFRVSLTISAKEEYSHLVLKLVQKTIILYSGDLHHSILLISFINIWQYVFYLNDLMTVSKARTLWKAFYFMPIVGMWTRNLSPSEAVAKCKWA